MNQCVSLRYLILLLALLLGGTNLQARPDHNDLIGVETLQNTLAAVADEVRPSVVAIRASRRVSVPEPARPKDAPNGQEDDIEQIIPAVGSGVIIDSYGLILTNEHVIAEADPADIEIVLYDGRSLRAKGITSDPRSDLAVLRVEADGLVAARLGDLSTVHQGHFAIVMGNPFGSAYESHGRPSMSFGVISALGQVLTHQLDPLDQRYYGNLIQTDAPINPGNSGGPLLNIHGEVIGITTAISTRSGSSQGVGYAIAIDQRTRSIIDRLSQGKRVEYGYLGVRLANLTRELRGRIGHSTEGGALIAEVQEDTPAGKADLQPGDIIVSYDGRRVENVDQVIRWVGATPVGSTVTAIILRDGKQLRRKIVLGRRDVPEGVHIETQIHWRGLTLANPQAEFLAKSTSLPVDAQGVLVMRVMADSDAQKLGLSQGQLIVEMAGQPVHNTEQLRALLPKLNGPIRVVIDGQTRKEIVLPDNQ